MVLLPVACADSRSGVGDRERLIQCLKVLKAEQYPDLSWARVVLAPLERLASSSFTSGAGLERTPFGRLLFIAARTALV